MLRILHANLKLALTLFLNRDPINSMKFLQKRKDSFYINYMDKLKPMRFDERDIIYEKGSASREIFLLLGGTMLNV